MPPPASETSDIDGLDRMSAVVAKFMPHDGPYDAKAVRYDTLTATAKNLLGAETDLPQHANGLELATTINTLLDKVPNDVTAAAPSRRPYQWDQIMALASAETG